MRTANFRNDTEPNNNFYNNLIRYIRGPIPFAWVYNWDPSGKKL